MAICSRLVRRCQATAPKCDTHAGSADDAAKTWDLAGDLPAVVTQFNAVALRDGSFVLTGGTTGGNSKNFVYRSFDHGKTWTIVNNAAAWDARFDMALLVVADGSTLLLGGRDNSGVVFQDVWRSANGGSAWDRVASATPWGQRQGFAYVVTSTDHVLIAGGVSGATGLHSDVWITGDMGVVWTRTAASAPWSPRHSARAVVLEGGPHDGAVLMVGGTNSVEQFNDVWRSADNGASWVRATNEAAWSLRHGFAVCSLPQGVVILCGGESVNAADDDDFPFVYHSECFRSDDGGGTWTDVGTPAPWGPRSLLVLLHFGDGRLAVLGGKGTAGVNDVWTSAPTSVGATWATGDCAVARRALCSAPAQPTAVRVALPRATTTVPPIAAGEVAVGTYVPPRAIITTDALPDSPERSSAITFNVAFSAPVLAPQLDGAAFTVNAGALAVTHRSVQPGSDGNSWTLRVGVEEGALECPLGFARYVSSEGTLCAYSIETPGSWEDQRQSCLPHSLATLSSVEADEFIRSLRSEAYDDYWYACVVWLKGVG